MQTSIDFSKPIIRKENNAESQAILEANESRFRGQCKTIMDAFLRGEKLSVATAHIRYKIGDLRRRIKDLKDNYQVEGIEAKMVGNGFKEWSLNKTKYQEND